MIEAYITNLGKYNEGELQGEYLKLPATKEEVQALFSRIGVDGVMYEEFFITNYESKVYGLKECLDQYESINELNFLATLLDDMDFTDTQKFEAAIVCGEHSGSVEDLINLAHNLDCYEIISEVSDHEELGRYALENFEGREIPDWMEDYFDYDSYGRDFDINCGGKFVDNGYAFDNQNTFHKFYDGKSIPEEHKIFAYPKPEKSIQKALANYSKMIREAPTSPSTEKAIPTPNKAER